MSELHKFLFDGLPVRGALVRITDGWQEVLRRRAANTQTGAWPQPVVELVGEMAAAGVLLQDSIAFNGALVLQIFGDGPVKVAVAEVLPDLCFRATATLTGAVAPDAPLSSLVNTQGQGRCAITLDPAGRLPGQQPYQGIAPLVDEHGHKLESLAAIIGHYMRQSEQIDTALVLAADERAACGLLIQRLPEQGEKNLAHGLVAQADEDEHFRRIAVLAQSLRREELLTLDADAILHRLFWQERVTRFTPLTGDRGPRFACSCSREGMTAMLRALGEDEVRDVLRERG
ncbi:MAG: Hsp33 family molecular chaperone HslO, partial [Burkholderiaceae bacterium]|nr:Hsp33 family molecular chaperone HslO [Burkholderiaceae bacterium]